MTTDEKLALIDRAEEWLEKLPELKASAASWEEADVKDFDEGLTICSCLRQASSFIEAAYQFDIKSCLNRIENTIREIVRIARPNGPRTETEKKTKKVKAFIPNTPAPDENGNVNHLIEADRIRLHEEAMAEEEKNDKYRPQELSGYIHLLSKDIQQECRNVKSKYYMPMREYRTRLESLVENPDATDEQRAEMATKLVEAEEGLAEFWEKVDLEYKKVTGQKLPAEPVKEKKISEFTKEDIDKVEDETMKEQLTKNRIENNKKYLRRDDLQVCDEVREQLLIRMREMEEYGVKLSKKQIENLQKHGIEVEVKSDKPAETKASEAAAPAEQANEPATSVEEPSAATTKQQPGDNPEPEERTLFN